MAAAVLAAHLTALVASACTFLCSHTPPFPTSQPMAPSRLITAPRLYYTRSLCIEDPVHSYIFMTA